MTQLKEFSTNPYEDTKMSYKSRLAIRVRNQHMEYLRRHVKGDPTILDMGARTPMTERLKELSTKPVINTIGDLDNGFIPAATKFFDTVVYSHTMEHQFNPLYTLLRLREMTTKNAKIFIFLPSRGKLLWTKYHYHEIDKYRFRMLMKRAGMEIVSIEHKKFWGKWWFYLTGIRPLMRLFFERMIYYECKFK
jgi:hypothetical protein